MLMSTQTLSLSFFRAHTHAHFLLDLLVIQLFFPELWSVKVEVVCRVPVAQKQLLL